MQIHGPLIMNFPEQHSNKHGTSLTTLAVGCWWCCHALWCDVSPASNYNCMEFWTAGSRNMPKWLYSPTPHPKPPEELMIPPRVCLFNHSLNVLGHARPSGTIHIWLLLICLVIWVWYTQGNWLSLPIWDPLSPAKCKRLMWTAPGSAHSPGDAHSHPTMLKVSRAASRALKSYCITQRREARSTARLGHFKYRMGHQFDRSVCRLVSNSSSKSQHVGIFIRNP